jgi:hypothetical protein
MPDCGYHNSGAVRLGLKRPLRLGRCFVILERVGFRHPIQRFRLISWGTCESRREGKKKRVIIHPLVVRLFAAEALYRITLWSWSQVSQVHPQSTSLPECPFLSPLLRARSPRPPKSRAAIRIQPL